MVPLEPVHIPPAPFHIHVGAVALTVAGRNCPVRGRVTICSSRAYRSPASREDAV